MVGDNLTLIRPNHGDHGDGDEDDEDFQGQAHAPIAAGAQPDPVQAQGTKLLNLV